MRPVPARQVGAAKKTLGRARGLSGRLVHPPTPPFGPYIAPAEKTLTPKDFAKYDSELRRHRRQDPGDGSLCSGTLPGRGIAPGAISIASTSTP